MIHDDINITVDRETLGVNIYTDESKLKECEYGNTNEILSSSELKTINSVTIDG